MPRLYRLDNVPKGVGALAGGFFMSKFMYLECKSAQEYRSLVFNATSDTMDNRLSYLQALKSEDGLHFATREHSTMNHQHDPEPCRRQEWRDAAKLPATARLTIPASNLVSTTTDPTVLNGIPGHESGMNLIFVMPDGKAPIIPPMM